MLKKFSHIALVFLLLVATTGMAVSKHYCGNFLISTSFYTKSEPCCESGSHCHDEEEFIQLEEEFAAPSISHIPFAAGLDLLLSEPGESTKFHQNLVSGFFKHKYPSYPPNIQVSLSFLQIYLL
jgi:hypothetical protein